MDQTPPKTIATTPPVEPVVPASDPVAAPEVSPVAVLEATSEATPVSLLDKITADPEFINRGIAEAAELTPMAAVPVAAAAGLPEAVQPLVLDRDNQHRVPLISLLGPRLAVARRRLPLPVLIGLFAVLAVGLGGFVVWWRQQTRPLIVVVTPTPTPRGSVVPSPSLAPAPTPAPTPSPSAAPAPVTVTAPVETPTADHPQAVTITSKSGLWLRSSPTSASRGNIIGWMPNGATISVDATGEFWWHGVYQGKPGYFAVSYTQ